MQDVSLENFELTGLEGISLDSVEVNGNFHFDNPSNAPVPVDTVTYTLTLEDTNEKIGNGVVESFVLEPGLSTAPFVHELHWVPTAQTAASLLIKDEVFVTVSGEVSLLSITIPFSDRIDMREYVEQFLPVEGIPEVQGDLGERDALEKDLNTLLE